MGDEGDEKEGSNEGHEGRNEGDEEEGSNEGHEGSGAQGDEEEGSDEGHEGHEGDEEEGSDEGYEGSNEGDEEEGSDEGHEGSDEGDEEEGSNEGHEGSAEGDDSHNRHNGTTRGGGEHGVKGGQLCSAGCASCGASGTLVNFQDLIWFIHSVQICTSLMASPQPDHWLSWAFCSC